MPHSESDSEADETDNSDAASDDEDEPSTKNSSSPEQSLEGENTDEEEEEENSSMLQDDASSLEMIMVKNVPAGAEVYVYVFFIHFFKLLRSHYYIFSL